MSKRWIALHAGGDKTFGAAELQKFIAMVGTAQAMVLNSDDVRFTQATKWRDAFIANVAKLAEPDRDPRVFSEELRDLPLEEVRASHSPTTRMAVVLERRRGWASIDKSVSEQLAARGIDVWASARSNIFGSPVRRIKRQRRGASTATLFGGVEKARRHRCRVFLRRRYCGLRRESLPEDLQSKIVSVNLLGLATTADFEVHVTTWLGVDHHGLKTQPEVDRLQTRVLCIYGEGEKDTLCPSLKNPRAQSVKVGDGHHFGDQYQTLAEKILAAVAAP